MFALHRPIACGTASPVDVCANQKHYLALQLFTLVRVPAPEEAEKPQRARKAAGVKMFAAGEAATSEGAENGDDDDSDDDDDDDGDDDDDDDDDDY